MKRNLLKNNADFFFGAVIVIFGAVGCYLTRTTIKLASARQMPMILFAFTAVMGLGISISSVVNRARDKEDQVKVSVRELIVGIGIPGAVLILSWVLIRWLGFYVSVFLLILALMVLQAIVTDGKLDLSFRKIALTVLFAVLVTAVMYGIFHFIFGLPTPEGLFGF